MLFSDVLGDDQDRYLTRWYRMAEYELREPSSTLTEHGASLLAQGHVAYPLEYLHRASRGHAARDSSAHVSSIDALSFAALTGHQLAHDLPSAGWIDQAWVSGFHIVAHQDPHLDLSAIPLSVTFRPKAEKPRRTAQLAARIGNLQVTLELTADEPDEHMARSLHSAATEPSPPSAVYGGLHRTTTLISEILKHDEVSQTLTSHHRVDHEGPIARGTGLDAGHWPCVTQIDYASLLGQVAQILSFSSGGQTRASAENLWIRRARIRLDHPPVSLPTEFTFISHVVRTRVLEFDGRRIRDVRLEAQSTHGVSGQADFAYFIDAVDRAESPDYRMLETCK